MSEAVTKNPSDETPARARDRPTKLINFGPGRNNMVLTSAVSEILYMTIAGEDGEERRAFRRTKSGRFFRMPPKVAEVIGIKPVNPNTKHANRRRHAAPTGEFAHVDKVFDSVISYVGASVLDPDQIVGNLQLRLEPAQTPAMAEVIEMPARVQLPPRTQDYQMAPTGT